jgi:hypothetical protein
VATKLVAVAALITFGLAAATSRMDSSILATTTRDESRPLLVNALTASGQAGEL